MKRLTASLLMLILLFSAALFHTDRLDRLTDELSGHITRAGELAEADDWSGAQVSLQKALDLWESRGGYLHTTLQHADIDEVWLAFHELQQYLEHRELDQSAALATSLVTRLELLSEMERFTLRNIF